MISKLTAGMSPDEKEQFEYEWTKSIQARKRVVELLEDRENQLVMSMIDDEKYGHDWPYYQSQRVAQVKEIKNLINLLK